jgi:glycosyltransferase involved in cell wall biosynthesis
LSEREERPTLLCVGRLGHNKNQARLLRAFKVVVESIPAAQLWLVGHGPEEARLKQLTEDLGLREHVTFQGRVPRQELVKLLHRAWLFSLLSDKEGLGVVFMEAQACGLPCIGPNVGGVPEVIESRQTGYLINCQEEDCEEMAASRIIQLLSDPVHLRSMSDAAIQKAEQEFGEDRAFGRFSEALTNAVEAYSKPVNRSTEGQVHA